jgi:hypothetical protein
VRTDRGFDPVPSSLDAVLDPAWLARALDLVGEHDRVVHVEQVDSLLTVAEKVRFAVTVEDDAGRRRVHPLCAKGHFGGGFNSLGTEAHAYRHLLPELSVRAPKSHHVGIDATGDRGLIIMDDVIELGGRILSAHDPYPVATCRESLSQLALLHASTWGDTRWEASWLDPRIAQTASMFSTESLQALLDDGRGAQSPNGLPDAKAVQAALARTAALEPSCVLHGDTHSGNAYLDAEGSVCWLDWQIAQRGHWSIDISYHLGTVLDVETRRVHEHDLLGHYLNELTALGAPAPSFDEAWDSYAAGFTWGFFLWVITRISSREVVLVHVPRLAAALWDHDTFRRLGVV